VTNNSRPVLESFYKTFERFFKTEVASGIVLLLATIVALLWANSPFASSYDALWHSQIFGNSLAHWINDGLMAIFFLSVGLEIKQELLIGRLASFKSAALPIIAAVGGMLVPALIYAFFNAGTPVIRGWGIPMATDIAFSLGVIALLGRSVPTSIRVFVAALAIVDDLGAVLVIAIFYTASLNITALIGVAVCCLILLALNRLKIGSLLIYSIVGICLWYAMLNSGIHATIAGVITALFIPLHSKGKNRISPMTRLSGAIHPFVAYFIIPLFALANAGLAVHLDPSLFGSNVFWGVGIGLLVGKTVGITLFSFAAVKIGLAELPQSINWWHMIGAAILCGIGFTMSLFIGELALGGQPEDFAVAKLSILLASLVAGVLGFVMLKTQRLEAID
jgi:Na+:H+ antiporter, NhaA family